MKKLQSDFRLLYSILYLLVVFHKVDVFPGANGMPEYVKNFENFTDRVVHMMETSEPTEHRPGVHLYMPFGIGYMLANIYESLWPVPVQEIPEAIFTLRQYVATDYAAILRLFKKRHFRISSTIYSRFGNVTKPPTFPQLLTQVISMDLHKNRTEFKESIFEIVDRGTKGHLAKEIFPKKDAAWKEVFDSSTHGVYVNTLHFKSEWDKPWRKVGEKRFFDNALVPYLELQGMYPYAETQNASAVIVDLQASRKQIILFKPHDFLTVTDMRRIIRGMLGNESLWKMENVTIQLPELNVTNLSQPSDKFPFLGVANTFCRGKNIDTPDLYYNQHPIAHANHFEFSPDFLEIASASGSLVAYQNNRDFLPKPTANQSQGESPSASSNVDYFDILEASEEEDERFQDYIIDARSGLPKLKNLRGELRAIFNNRNGSAEEDTNFSECDPTADMETMGSEDDTGEAFDSSTMMSLTGTNVTDLQDAGENLNLTDTDTDKQEGKMLIFDKPFSWILRDKEIGDVFYGSVSSLCQYHRAVQHTPTVPVWVLDLFKAFYWRCV